jgi:uncharacterized NAD(P)/FAD-binding protein YdhS
MPTKTCTNETVSPLRPDFPSKVSPTGAIRQKRPLNCVVDGKIRTTTNRRGTMHQPIEIGVVGGGAAAVCLLDALAQADSAPGGITVFEPSTHLWRGRPYQPDMATVRVNIPPNGMSVRFGDTDHFQRFLATRDRTAGSAHADYEDPFCGVRFVPRAVFGDYLEQSARAALTRLRERGWRIDLVRERVDSAVPEMNRVTLQTTRGQRVTVDYTVLCVGAGGPTDAYFLAGSPGFIGDPYPLAHQLLSIDAERAVGVIGSGLTAVDVVLGLAARGHQGRIRLLSRSGVLPMVRQRPVPYALQHFTPEKFRAIAARNETVRLDQVIAMMRAELAAAGEDLGSVVSEIAAIGREDPVRLLRRHLAEVDSPSLALRILQRAVPATGPDVWPLLSEHEKAQVQRSHYRTVMSLCCPMPPSSAAKLLELIDSGQLEITPGIQHITAATGGGFTITANDREHTADYVINALNVPARRIAPKAQSLIDSLVAAGVVNRHPRGGVHVARATSQLITHGTADPRLYALGDLASGSLFFTFGLPWLVDRAYDIVGAVLNDRRAAMSGQLDRVRQMV